MRHVTAPRFKASFLSPRHWLAWVGTGVIWLIGRLPFPLWRALGRGLGRLTLLVRNQRRRVAERNIALCFPELDAAQQRALLDEYMRDIGMMLIEFCVGWMASDSAIRRIPVQVEGLEHIEAARARGQGILLVDGHFSHLELCGRMLAQRVGVAAMYRRMDSPVLDWVVLRARLHYIEAMIEREDLRDTVRLLREGGTLWYAPDQDMRGKQRIFAPFFGVPAATIPATHHLARLSGACVIPFFHRRLDDGSYALRVEAPLEGVPSDDVQADTTAVNAAIERMVREAPAQYLWLHKRFKTRPQGEPPVY